MSKQPATATVIKDTGEIIKHTKLVSELITVANANTLFKMWSKRLMREIADVESVSIEFGSETWNY